jgi:tetratricopeptide (TPR) repeat protein
MARWLVSMRCAVWCLGLTVLLLSWQFVQARDKPRDAADYVNRGDAHEAEGKHAVAIADYSQALRLDPRSVGALAGRGCAYRKTNEFDRALADLSEALRLDPRCFAALVLRADVHVAKQEYPKAVRDLTEALRFAPQEQRADVHACRGAAFHGAGERDQDRADEARAGELEK